MSENTRPRVKVTGAPGYEDFEGELILDSEHFTQSVVVAFMSEGVQHLAAVPRECVTRLPEPRSGYTPCACRDCMDVTVSGDMTKPELCSSCEGEGCEPFRPGDSDYESLPGHMRDCQRDDAYGEA